MMLPPILPLLTLLPGVVNVKAHPGFGYPKVIGGTKSNFIPKSRSLDSSLKEAFVEKRAPTGLDTVLSSYITTTCGPNVGSCDDGYCCSLAGLDFYK
jgi:hypothetical protein